MMRVPSGVFFQNILYRISATIRAIFSQKNLYWHLVAIVATFVLVTSGFDWWYFERTRGSAFLFFSLPAAFIGFIVPFSIPLCFYAIARMRSDSLLAWKGSAIAQAEILALVISSTYKAFTGRMHPEYLTYTSFVDISREFQFGFLRHGVFWGWPSSHTAVACAGAMTLAIVYSGNRKIWYGALVYALYIGVAVSMSIHWFSDFVAGAIIGTLIGMVVGYSFKRGVVE